MFYLELHHDNTGVALMCLQFGDTTQCVVLRNAPAYKGDSLEWVEHKIEENHTPPDPDAWQAIANACGWSLETYRERAAIKRGDNALEQLKLNGNDISRIGRGIFFWFPPECQAWVLGEIHTYPDPDILWLDPAAAQVVHASLSEMRSRWFWRRISRLDPTLPFVDYPERISWMLGARTDGRKWKLLEAYLQRLEWVNPEALKLMQNIRLTLDEIHALVSLRMEEFLVSRWQPDREIIESILTPDEVEQFETFGRRRRELYNRRLKVTRDVRTKRKQYRGEFLRWSNKLREKYEVVFGDRLREHLLMHNLAVEPTLFRQAA